MEPDIALGPDPVVVFTTWYDDAVAANDPFPDAMSLATATRDGRPAVRVVLYKGLSAGMIRFFTNYLSRKGREIGENPAVAAAFHWTSLARQVRVEGRVERLSEAESDAYFASRDRQSQLGAWASEQSENIADRSVLEQRYRDVEQRFAGRPIERPPHWGGFRIVPVRFEFWIGQQHRLHDRFVYEPAAGGWQRRRLSP